MTFKHTISTAVEGLRSNITRAILTILGIVIGVAAIIIVMSLGSGAQSLILGQINKLGTNTVDLMPGNSKNGDFSSSLYSKSLTERDFEAIKKKSNVPNLIDAMPTVVVSGVVSYRSETAQPSTIGGDARFFADTFDAYPESGEGDIFYQSDIDSNARVIVIGSQVREDLFGAANPIGKSVTLKNQKFRVIGVFPEKGSAGVFNIDNTIIMPYTAAQTYLGSSDSFNEIILKADNAENVDKLVYDVRETLRETHRLSSDQDDDFTLRTQKELVSQVSTIVLILTSFLSMVVAISLIVGGIGIMNIMLVSVSERTKEIGLRKSLGATGGDILRQFLYEAVILTGIGGVVGVVVGAFVSFVAALVLSHTVSSDWQFVFPISAAILGVGVSAGVGLVFGIYPARKASQKSPIEALRYE